jgi:hypothetical protein
VTNPGSNNTTVLDPVHDTVVAWMNRSAAPGAVAYDPVSRAMIVGNYDLDTVSLYNATTRALRTNATVGSGPIAIAVDTGSGAIFVANELSDNVTKLGAAGTHVGSAIAVGTNPYGAAYDPADGNVYIADYGSDLLSVVNSTTGTGVGGYSTGNGPVAAAVDPATGAVYSANYDSGSLTIVSPVFSVALFRVTFSEEGLPSGTPWAVRLDGVGHVLDGSSTSFEEPNGTEEPYSALGPSGYVADPAIGSIAISGNDVTVVLNFTLRGAGPVPFPVVFSESGLPSGTDWSVTFNGTLESSSNASLSFLAINASGYSFSVGAVPEFVADPANGSVSVAGPVEVQIEFSPATGGSGANYTVSFVASGLPAGVVWTVRVGAETNTSTTAWANFSLPNGTGYAFAVTSLNYTANPSTGAFNVSGATTVLRLAFQERPVREYALTFTESGLPAGTSWSVTVDGSTLSSSASSLVLVVANGSYSFSVGAVAGYSVNVSSATVTVSGGGRTVYVGFASDVPPGPGSAIAGPHFLGLPFDLAVYLLGGLGLLGAVVAASLVARRRTRSVPSRGRTKDKPT